jgi:hypothetical protein
MDAKPAEIKLIGNQKSGMSTFNPNTGTVNNISEPAPTNPATPNEIELQKRALAGDTESQNILAAIDKRKAANTKIGVEIRQSAKVPGAGTGKGIYANLSSEEQQALSNAIDNGLDPYKVNSRTAKVFAQQELVQPGRQWNVLGAQAAYQRNVGVSNTKAILNAIDPLLNQMEETGKVLGNTDIVGYNTAKNYLKEKTGDPGIVGFKNLRDDTIAEVERGLLNTGVLSDSKYLRAVKNVNESQSYSQLQSAIKNMRFVIATRLEAVNRGPYPTADNQSPTSMPPMKVEPRKPGESIGDYLKRTGG